MCAWLLVLLVCVCVFVAVPARRWDASLTRMAAGMGAVAATALLTGRVERRGVAWCGRGRGRAEGGA